MSQNSNAACEVPGSPAARRALTGKRILVVDSSELCRKMVANALLRRSANVVVECSSDDALLSIIHSHPDAIISGIEIGRISGYDLCLILKLMPDYAGIPVILMSSSEADKVSHLAATVGADFYVHKDVELVDHVNELLDRVLLAGTVDDVHVLSRRRLESVVLVDDSQTIRRIIGNILKSVGVTSIREAADGCQGLKQMEAGPVDLVITDWNMPVMSGIEMVRELRKQPRFAKLPIIMITTEGGAREVAEARAAGVSEHLRKPFSVQRVIQAFDSVGLSVAVAPVPARVNSEHYSSAV